MICFPLLPSSFLSLTPFLSGAWDLSAGASEGFDHTRIWIDYMGPLTASTILFSPSFFPVLLSPPHHPFAFASFSLSSLSCAPARASCVAVFYCISAKPLSFLWHISPQLISIFNLYICAACFCFVSVSIGVRRSFCRIVTSHPSHFSRLLRSPSQIWHCNNMNY